ncbi:MAG: transporter [Acidobacteriaceae bacterium]|nr:transporter [Acidobacteriaceae bacterium]
MNGSRPRIFYGWWIVFTCALGLLSGVPIAVYSFGVFFKALANDFHASRAAISFAFTLYNVVGAFSVPMIGWLIDRYGARRVIIPATVLYALILISGTTLGSGIWRYYLFYAALGLAGSGTNPVPYGVIVAHWFNRRRGLALGFMLLGIGIGGTIVPIVTQRLIANFGWRMTYGILGCAVLLLPLPMVATFLQNDPSERGLLPDGAEATPDSPRQDLKHEGLSWHEIWHSSTFWIMTTSFFLAGASVHAGVLHMPALLTDRGLSAERGAVASSVIGLSLIAGRFGAGFLLDRFFAPRVAMLLLGASGVGLGILWAGSTGNLALAAAFLVGFGMGAEADIIAYLFGRYFGLRAFGIAFGHAFGAFMLAGALGTLLMGAAFDWTHSYTVGLGGFCIAMMLAVALLMRLGPYRFGAEQPSGEQLKGIPAASSM